MVINIVTITFKYYLNIVYGKDQGYERYTTNQIQLNAEVISKEILKGVIKKKG